MPFGAHEAMETHEMLMEKINMITHFNLYAQSAKTPELRDMIVRHQQEEITAYNELVALTRGNAQFTPISSNTNVRGMSHQQIEYGLNNPPRFQPQVDAAFSDQEVAIAMLLCHKNSARNCTWAALECADPNLRRSLQNCAATCVNQAYEVFLLMNRQGWYQVPTLNTRTAQNFLQSYQPAPSALQTQYGAAGYSSAPGGTGTNTNTNTNMANFAAGSRESVFYGGGTGASPYQAPMTNNAMGQMRQ